MPFVTSDLAGKIVTSVFLVLKKESNAGTRIIMPVTIHAMAIYLLICLSKKTAESLI